jgi:hypothetical protein
MNSVGGPVGAKGNELLAEFDIDAVVSHPLRGSMFPWITAVVLLVFPIATADFDYRYLLPAITFACLAAGLGLPRYGSSPSRRRPGRGQRGGGASQGRVAHDLPGPRLVQRRMYR